MRQLPVERLKVALPDAGSRYSVGEVDKTATECQKTVGIQEKQDKNHSAGDLSISPDFLTLLLPALLTFVILNVLS